MDSVPLKTTWWTLIRDNYLAFDRRPLGFARFVLGFYLIGDLFRREVNWSQMFSDEGVLPIQVNLARGQGVFSILNAFASPLECWALFFVILATYVCLFVGYRTKVMQILTILWVTGLNCRL